ncbi:MAG: neutral/alkaline non-lysosomal ceramidase N-terminal domain-containing protein, partial [Bacteroidota bacterium]
MRITRRILVMLAVAAVVTATYLYYRLHDRYPDYQPATEIASNKSGPVSAGFSAVAITPQVPDSWTDKNGDAMYNEADGDTYTDKNGNGQFDAVWLAGFQNNRPASGVHDDLWARTMIVDDGSTRIALVALDLIGFGADDVNEVKEMIPASWGITYTFITSTHTHEGPDVVGLWGKSEFKSGVNQTYLSTVKENILRSLGEAVKNMRPARIVFAQDTAGAKNLVDDYREPVAYDYGLRLMHFRDAVTDTTLGTLIQWANHPETLWAGNLEITSDFPHYLREAFENGIYSRDSLLHEGKKGITLFVNGAIGGMMSTGTSFSIPDISGDTSWTAPVFEKARAQGEQLALLALKSLENNPSVPLDTASIRLSVRQLDLPLDNKLYRLGAAMGIFNRGLSGWWKIRTEI